MVAGTELIWTDFVWTVFENKTLQERNLCNKLRVFFSQFNELIAII